MEIKQSVQLKDYSTFKIGGPAKYFCEVEKLSEVKEVLNWANEHQQKTFILGGGSNVLFMDKGFDGMVIRVNNKELIMHNENVIRSGSGVVLIELVNFSVKNGFEGLEWAAGIPGFVGGALRGNAGAFGGEIKDCIKNVRAINIDDGFGIEDLELQEFDNAKCEFEYRNSFFKKNGNYIIWDCEIELKKGDAHKSNELITEILHKRGDNKPSLAEFPSIGSIFKNPIVAEEIRKQFERDKNVQCRDDKVPAGWLIEQCDLKEKRIGGAMVSPIQANFIVSMGNAQSEDVLILLSLIKMKVRNEFGVQLEEEVQIVM